MADPEFYSVVAGAIVGGLIALGAQEFNHRRTAGNAAAAARLSVLIKLIRIQADHFAVLQTLLEGRAFAASHGMTIVQATLPGVNHPSPIDLTSEELAAVYSTADPELGGKTLLVSSRHSTMIRLSEEYRRITDEMKALGDGVPDARGMADVNLTGNAAVTYQRLHYEAEMLLKEAFVHNQEQVREVGWMMRVLHLSMRRIDDSTIQLQSRGPGRRPATASSPASP